VANPAVDSKPLSSPAKTHTRGARFSPEEIDKLKQLWRMFGVPVRGIVREAVLDHLKRHRDTVRRDRKPPQRARWGSKVGWTSVPISLTPEEHDAVGDLSYTLSISPNDFIHDATLLHLSRHGDLLSA